MATSCEPVLLHAPSTLPTPARDVCEPRAKQMFLADRHLITRKSPPLKFWPARERGRAGAWAPVVCAARGRYQCGHSHLWRAGCERPLPATRVRWLAASQRRSAPEIESAARHRISRRRGRLMKCEVAPATATMFDSPGALTCMRSGKRLRTRRSAHWAPQPGADIQPAGGEHFVCASPVCALGAATSKNASRRQQEH